jgi:hypothetical protein
MFDNIDDLLSEDKKKIFYGRGRPKKEVKLDKRVTSFLSENEYNKLTVFAKNKNLTISEVVRKIILEKIG